MLDKRKLEILKKNNRELKETNNALAKENRRLRDELQRHAAVVKAAEKYKDEHTRALTALDNARQKYVLATRELIRQKELSDKEFKDLLSKI